jgi:dTDP-4-dehydro-6-deoxy-alpha-D-glucopyranose 2,3-dehydratase
MNRSTQEIQIKFLRSAYCQDDVARYSMQQVLDWTNEKVNETKVVVNEIPLSHLADWTMNDGSAIRHTSGKFFSIEGIHIETNFGVKSNWDQPIINQPEIGFLGIITKEFNGILHFLIQAKIEPGNINIVQLSPTLQATRSNYTRIHKGKSPLYLEYFNGIKDSRILIDQFQSEQGARFLKKRNRNIIIEVGTETEIPEYDNFIWLTLNQLNQLMRKDNIINMDTRTVISSIFFYLSAEYKLNSTYENNPIKSEQKGLLKLLENNTPHKHIGDIISWITFLKFNYELNVTSKSLLQLDNWHYNGITIHHNEGKYFNVIGVNVEIDNREVISWNQPMIQPAQEGILGFIVRKINDTYHFLVQAKVEAGNFDILELAPTVQCLTGNYRTGYNEYSVPFINEILGAREDQIWHRSYQSEEGGRFYHEQNLNLIVEVDSDFPIEIPENYCWMTLDQLNNFMRFNNYLNIGARSLISLISL